jgi:TolA-binding protein
MPAPVGADTGPVTTAEPSAHASESSAVAEGAAPPAPRLPNPDLALYKAAHRLHFGEKDYARALSAWDRYLQTFPQGIFAVEARYNHALCLVRLGRKADAIRELTPFAAGEVANGHRRDEARALLTALQDRP